DDKMILTVAAGTSNIKVGNPIGSNVAFASNGGRKIKVVFIVGFTRSGSTLLEHLLSIAPGTVAVGELAYLWDPNVRNNSYCGCGVKWDCCPFWTRTVALQ